MEPETTQDNTTEAAAVAQPNPYIIPGAILIGFAMIAAAIFFSGGFGGGGSAPTPAGGNNQPQEVAEKQPIRAIDENDHILGNPNAPIVIVEYSDYDCPFCKNFHETMNTIIDEYGSTGEVAWVYRHFPLDTLHPNAPGIALAAECVANLAGNDAFWTFSDLIFGERTTNAPTNVAKLSDYATQAGVTDIATYETCVSEGQFIDQVNEDFQDGINAGVRGTPHSIVIVGDQQIEINGAQPYGNVKQIVDTLLDQVEG